MGNELLAQEQENMNYYAVLFTHPTVQWWCSQAGTTGGIVILINGCRYIGRDRDKKMRRRNGGENSKGETLNRRDLLCTHGGIKF